MPPTRARAIEWLLALLTLRHGRAVDRVWLAGTLWADSGEEQALRNLRNNLTHLRNALGAESVRLQSPTRDTLTFNLDGADVDVLRFDRGVQAGDEAGLQEAADAYAGLLLEGCFEEWVATERNHRAQACLNALETLADAAEKRGDVAGALTLSRRAEGMDALNDSIQRRLMRVLTAHGDAPAALHSYRAYRLRLREAMNVEPDAETVRLYQQIREQAQQAAQHPQPERQEPPPASVSAPTASSFAATLPYPLTALIGRERESRDIAQALAQARLVTLVGGGGVGKTRLSIQVARALSAQFAQGIAFVALASLADPALLNSFVATALGMRVEEASDPEFLLQALAGWLATQEALLVLDNCEHLLEATALLTQTLLERCPDLRILATSRQRLGLTGEVVWRVPSLPAPDLERLAHAAENAVEMTLGSPAGQLFAERATMARPGFRLTEPEEALAVAQICHQLDGIPLAIELAAARVTLLTVRQIAARLDDRFRLLTGGSKGVLTRHQTLRALIDWSYALLTEEEQALLRRLAVFVGGWTLEAAEALAESDILEALSSLLDKSLVLSEERAESLRYRMLETVRQYAEEKLRERGEQREAQTRCAEYHLVLAERARPFLAKPEPAWLDRLESEHSNLRAALTFFAEQEETVEKAVRLAVTLQPFWNARGYFYEQRVWFIGLASRPTPPTETRTRVLAWAASEIASDGEVALAKEMYAEGLAISRQLGDRSGMAMALTGLAELEPDPNAARPLVEESLAMMREAGDRQGMAHHLFFLGRLARQVADNAAAWDYWMECREQDEALGVKGGYVLPALADLAQENGDYAAARRFYGTFLMGRQEIGDRWSVTFGLQQASALDQAEGALERAAQLLGAALTLREAISKPFSPEERAPYDNLRSALREALGEVAFANAWEAGGSMTSEQAVQFAMEEA